MSAGASDPFNDAYFMCIKISGKLKLIHVLIYIIYYIYLCLYIYFAATTAASGSGN